MIRLGIIGLGHMGGYHASISKLIPAIDLIAVSDLSDENLNKINSTKIIKSKNYADWLDLVDAVIIAVPTEYHYSVTKECLLKNKHVLVEKPLTKSIDQAIELFNLAEKNNCALHVGHVERFNGAVQELKKIITNPYLIESHRIGPFTPRVQKDSVILDLMIHDLDIIVGLVNSPLKKLSVVGSKIRTDLTDLAVVQLQFENNVLANIISSRAAQIKQRSMSIHQPDAYIKLDFTTQDIFIHRDASASVKIGPNELRYKQEGTIERLFVYKDNPLKIEQEYFIKSIKLGKNLTDSKNDINALKLALELEKLVGLENYHDCSNSGHWKSSSRSL